MKKDHPTQQRILAYLSENGEAAITVRELQEELGLSSTSVVHHHLKQLESKGYIRKDPQTHVFEILRHGQGEDSAFVNLYGLAQCGAQGRLLDQTPEERIPVASRLIGFPESEAFLVRARGDSMEPRIHEGDLIIARRAQQARSGDVVVCSLNGEALIKQWVPISDNRIELRSFNEAYAPVAVDDMDTFFIVGLVRGVLSYF